MPMIKLAGKWIEAETLTHDERNAIDAVVRVLQAGYSVAVVAVEIVQTGDNVEEMIDVEVPKLGRPPTPATDSDMPFHIHSDS
jgi:hypothetical protein